MLISVIIPAYNARKFIGSMLDSLVAQHFKDMEVVIADDCSPEAYDDVIEQYESRLNIVRTKTEYNCCPGNTRQAGYDASHGEWVMFGDQDDRFAPDAIKKMAAHIRKNPEAVVIFSDFDEVSEEGEVLRHHSSPAGWTHGKAFKREWWESHHLKYKKDLKSHEDIYLSSLVTCCLQEDKLEPSYLPATTYLWTQRKGSLTHCEKELFIENHMEEYIQATGWVYLLYWKNCKEESKFFAKWHAIGVVLYIYFYHMGVIFRNADGFRKEMTPAIMQFIQTLKRELEMTNDDLLLFMAQDRGRYYWKHLEMATIATGPYIPCMTIQRYLEVMAPEEIDATK